MKKQFQILAATFITVAFISCSKERIEMTEMPSTTKEEIATSNSSNRPYIDPLTVSLEARFEFNGNLKSQPRTVADGVPSRRAPGYGFDRKGNFKSSLYLDGAYSVKLNDIPQQTNTSLSVWVKPAQLDGAGGIVENDVWQEGPAVCQAGQNLGAAIFTGVSTPGDYFPISNSSWHHVVITFDGSNLRVYINNVLKATLPHSASIPTTLSDFFVGWNSVFQFWTGYVDDLRFYSRTLSASDVQKLYNL